MIIEYIKENYGVSMKGETASLRVPTGAVKISKSRRMTNYFVCFMTILPVTVF
jgi:hypothetical protein